MKNSIEILLINPDTRDQDIFSFALNDLQVSYNCRFAKNVKDAIKKLRTIIPDYIFIDMKERKTGKFFCLKQIKKIVKLKDTQVIICSDDHNDQSSAKALRLGARMCINKTSIIADLIFILKGIFANNKPVSIA
ncbi:MAG TPA: response regulator [Parafilimonas sp.]|nr:response regulator [Parafilimonas sp.]